MVDISFLVFEDEHGFYRLEGNDPNNQTRVDMTQEEADAWIDAQSQPTLQQCPYCQQYHEPHLIERCPRKPKYKPLQIEKRF